MTLTYLNNPNKQLLVPTDVALAILERDFLYATKHGISLDQYMGLIDPNWPITD